MRNIPALIVCAALGLSAAAAEKKNKPKEDPKKAAAPTKKKTADTKKPEPKKAATPAAASSSKAPPPPEATPRPARLNLPLPRGLESKGVNIPYTDATGKKTMYFRIGTGTRMDDDHVKMSELVIETYDDSGEKEMTITLPSARMNLATRVIEGDRSVTIQRSDFQLTGDTMEFNTETKQGWVRGIKDKVTMIIYDLSEETGDTDPKKEKKGS